MITVAIELVLVPVVVLLGRAPGYPGRALPRQCRVDTDTPGLPSGIRDTTLGYVM